MGGVEDSGTCLLGVRLSMDMCKPSGGRQQCLAHQCLSTGLFTGCAVPLLHCQLYLCFLL